MGTINFELTSGTSLIGRWGMNESSGTTITNSIGSVSSNLVNGPTWVNPGAPFNIAPPAPPVAPTLLAATPTAGLQIDLSWTDNSNNETSFKVERSQDGETGWTQIGISAANASTFSDAGLAPGTPYCYRVRASNSVGDSAYSNTSCTSTPGEPNNGLNFGTQNAYVDLDNPPTLKPANPYLETWFKTTAPVRRHTPELVVWLLGR